MLEDYGKASTPPAYSSRKKKVEDATAMHLPLPSSAKRARSSSKRSSAASKVGHSNKGDDNRVFSPYPKKKSASPSKNKDAERRLRVFRKMAPLSYLEKLERATSQRMFVIDRSRGGTEDVPEETIDMAGTTGNIYSITISQMPRCTCPDNQKGHQCKHIVYVRLLGNIFGTL